MKLGKGINRVIFNRETMINIFDKHFQYETDQVITELNWDEDENGFVVWFDDKPVAEGGEKE